MTDSPCTKARPPETDAETIARLTRELEHERKCNEELAARLDALTAPAAAMWEAATRPDFQAIGKLVDDEAAQYEFRGDQDYTPTDQERALLLDFGHGLIDALSEHGFLAPRALPLPATEPVGAEVETQPGSPHFDGADAYEAYLDSLQSAHQALSAREAELAKAKRSA